MLGRRGEPGRRRRRVGRRRPVPPAAAQRLEQRRGVGVSSGLGLHQADPGLLVLALRIEQCQLADRAELVLAGRQIERFAGQGQRLGLGAQRGRVGIDGAQHIGHVLERHQHGRLVLRLGLFVRRLGGTLLGGQRAAVEYRLGQSRGHTPHDQARLEQVFGPQRGHAERGGQVELRVLIGLGHADLRAGRVQQRFAGANVRALTRQGRGQRHGQLLGQLQGIELELRHAGFAGQLAGVDGELVARLGQGFFQPRQRRARLGDLGALAEHAGARDGARGELALNHGELLFLQTQDFAGGLQLRAQRRLPYRRGHDIGGQGQVGRLDLEALVVHAGRESFQGAPVAAEQIHRVTHVHAGREQVVRGQARTGQRRVTFTFGVELRAHRRVLEAASGRVQGFLRLAQCRLRRRHRGAVLQRRTDQPVQWLGVKDRPPLCGQVLGVDEALRCAGGPRGRGGLRGLRCGRVAWRTGRALHDRRLEIRTHGAPRHRQGGDQRTPAGDRHGSSLGPGG